MRCYYTIIILGKIKIILPSAVTGPEKMPPPAHRCAWDVALAPSCTPGGTAHGAAVEISLGVS